MDKLPIRQSLILFSALGATGYLGLYYFTAFLPVLLCVFLVGTGYGCNGLMVTTLSSFAPERLKSHIYPIQYTLANIAAACGPLFVHSYIRPLDAFAPFLFTGCMFLLGSTVAFQINPAQLPHIESSKKFHHHALLLLKKPQMLRLLAATTCGWMLYTQKFAVLPLFIKDYLHAPALIGTAMLVFSTVIIATAVPFSALSAKRRFSTSQLLSLGFGLYSSAYMLMGLVPGTAALFAGIALCALAESIMMPTFNTMIRDVTEPSERLAGFALGAVAIAVGEFLGMMGGVEGFRYFDAQDSSPDAFLFLGCAGVFFLVLYLVILSPKQQKGL